MHPKNALVAAPISLARSMREQREIAWAMSTIRCKSFCQSVKGRTDDIEWWSFRSKFGIQGVVDFDRTRFYSGSRIRFDDSAASTIVNQSSTFGGQMVHKASRPFSTSLIGGTNSRMALFPY